MSEATAQAIVTAYGSDRTLASHQIIAMLDLPISRQSCDAVIRKAFGPRRIHEHRERRRASIDCNYTCPTCGMGYDKFIDAEECCK